MKARRSVQANLFHFRRLREAAVEREQLLYALVRPQLGVNRQGFHQREVVTHLIGEAGLTTQLRHQVHQLGHARADVARLRP